MRLYHVKFRVRYVGGETDEWNDAITEQEYHWYSDGGQCANRMNALAESRDYKGRKAACVTMALQKITD